LERAGEKPSRRLLDAQIDVFPLARNLKELGPGKVWIAATGQQTLAEIVEKAAHNSAELNKLRDCFPIPINLDAQDIREITYRRLLTKSPEGEQRLKDEFGRYGQGLLNSTRLTDAKAGGSMAAKRIGGCHRHAVELGSKCSVLNSFYASPSARMR
jgi:hypothetical protein